MCKNALVGIIYSEVLILQLWPDGEYQIPE